MPFHSPVASLDTCELGTSPPGAWLCHLHLQCTRTNSLGGAQQPQQFPGEYSAAALPMWQGTLRTGTCVSPGGCRTSLWCARSRARGIFIAEGGEAETVQGGSHSLQSPALSPPQCLFTTPKPCSISSLFISGRFTIPPSPDLLSSSSGPPTTVCHQHGMATKSWHTELLLSGDLPGLGTPVPSLIQAPAVAQVAPELCPETVLALVSPHSCSAASCSLLHCSCSWPSPWVNLGGCRTRQGREVCLWCVYGSPREWLVRTL